MNRERAKKILYSALQGKLLLGLGIDKYLGQILFFFLMAIIFIWLNLKIEGTIHRKEENKIVLENLRSIHTEKTCELTALNSVCRVEEMLKVMGSDVQIPRKQAVTPEQLKQKSKQ